MKRYPCKSRIGIRCQEADDGGWEITVLLIHAARHVTYTDVSLPPGAADIIRENVQWLTPVAMVGKVQSIYPAVTAKQIHKTWTGMSQMFWHRDPIQLLSVGMILEELKSDVDIFQVPRLLEGVEMLCWG